MEISLTLRDVLTGLAVLISVFALWRSRRLDKRDLFLRMHEALIDPEVVAGRRVLYTLDSREQAAALASQEEKQTQVYRALAMFDLLGLYVENNWISEKTVLEEWSNSLNRSIKHADHFINARYETVQWHSWPHYRKLAEKATKVSPSPQPDAEDLGVSEE